MRLRQKRLDIDCKDYIQLLKYKLGLKLAKDIKEDFDIFTAKNMLSKYKKNDTRIKKLEEKVDKLLYIPNGQEYTLAKDEFEDLVKKQS